MKLRSKQNNNKSIKNLSPLICGSRAIDISMINNSAVNTSNPRAKSLQNAIKSTPGWLENYGPFIIEKMNNGKAIQAPWARTCCADGHTRHIHISTPK